MSEILCGGKVRLIAQDLNRVFYSDLGEAVPSAIRSLVLCRDHGQCAIEVCRSRYRLQIHHLLERSRGGSHRPDNLITLCSSWSFNPLCLSHEVGLKNHELSPSRRHPWARDGYRSRVPGPPETAALAEWSRSATA
ncbi:MAG: HNH endonuclease [Acidimicrobiia bacterium]